MHFHNFTRKKRHIVSLIIPVALTLTSLAQGVNSVSKGYSNIDADEPYKSYVGKILPDQETDGNVHKSRRANNLKEAPHLGRSTKKIKVEESHSHHHEKTSKSWGHEVKTKGRGMSSADKGKPKWYFSDPMKHLGKTVPYEPTDPNEPDPSAKITGRGMDDKEAGTGGGGTISAGKGKQYEVVDFGDADVDPEAPGWFALKETSDFGKKLSLGTLLRKKGNKDPMDNSTDPVTPDVLEPEDGENNDPSENMTPLHRKYDKACLHLEYKDAKAAAIPPIVSEATRQKIQSQNQLLAEFFLDLTFNIELEVLSPPEKLKDATNEHPLATQQPEMGFELLRLTKDIFFEQICKDKEFDEVDAKTNYHPEKDRLLPKKFVEGVFHLFLKLHSITRSLEIKDYLDDTELSWIRKNLEMCNQTQGRSKKILWFPDECKETVIAFDQVNNYACTPYLEFDFDIKKYDPILDFMWHMITAVHSHCFESFQSNVRMWHRYGLAMADLFPPEMRLRWSSSSTDYEKLYKRFFGPHYEVYFDNMNRCMYAATLRSDVPYLLPRFEGDRKARFAPYRHMVF